MKYICTQCKKPAKTIRIDFNDSIGQRVWKCDQCYFNKDKPKKK